MITRLIRLLIPLPAPSHDGGELVFTDAIPEGAPCPDFDVEPQLGAPLCAPNLVDPDFFRSLLNKLS